MAPPPSLARPVYAAAALVLVHGLVAAGACKSASSPGTGATSSSSASTTGAGTGGGSDSGAVDAGPDVIVDPDNCIPPGTANNAAGVGGYCSPGGGQCKFSDGGSAICTADFGAMVPPHAWFCTSLCDPDAGTVACGDPGPPCVTTPLGESVCLPETCFGFLTDAGLGSDVGNTNETVDVDGG